MAAIGDQATRLYRDALVWDAHSGFDPQPHADLENLKLWRDAGVDYLSVDVGYDLMPWTTTMRSLAVYRRWLQDHPADYRLCGTVADVDRARADGVMAVTFDLEGMNALDGEVAMVGAYYTLGVRQMLFAYNRNNEAGGGCHDDDVGLTPFGRAVVGEMNRLGMLVDCSHTAHRSTMEVMELSTEPVIFSHSNAWGLCRHGRNIKDDQIKACAATGGVIGINGLGLFLGNDDISSGRFVDHVAYMADLVGAEHVGIALDYAFAVDGPSFKFESHPEFWPHNEYPPGHRYTFVPPGQLPEIADTMLKRGFGEEAVKGVLGENFRRVAARVWR